MSGNQEDILTSVGVKQNQSQQALWLEILTTLESDAKTHWTMLYICSSVIMEWVLL